MSSELPTTRTDWKQAANDNNIELENSLADSKDIPSASKFKFDHFLLLRILYKQAQPPGHLAASDGFPKKDIEKVRDILDKNPDACQLKDLLKEEGDIIKKWDGDNYDKSGKFAMPLEHLHLIANRTPAYMGEHQDVKGNKVNWSPPQTRAAKSRALGLRGSPSTPSRRRPLPHERDDDDASPESFDDTPDLSDLVIESEEELVSPPDTDARRARNDNDRSDFSQGDEQTVNAALVSLMIVLSWLLRGPRGRILCDREKYEVPRDDKTPLYSASVDGLIRHLHDDTINGFIEVKGDLRGFNQPVRRQIGAQMAAFIYRQDITIGKKKGAKAPFQGQGKQAKNKKKKK